MGAQLLPWPVSDRHKQVMGLTEEFVRECVLPSADDADNRGEFPAGLQEAFHQTGIAHDFVDPRPGDEFPTQAALVAESLAYGCAAFASYLMLPVFFNRVVIGSLPPAESEAFKEDCRRRPVVTSFAATERASGSDLLAMAVRRSAKMAVTD